MNNVLYDLFVFLVCVILFFDERMISLLYSFDYCDSVYVLCVSVYKLQKENEKVDEE